MKLKIMLKTLIIFILAVAVLTVIAGCKKEDDLSKLFDPDELGEFWDLKADDAELVDNPVKSNGEDSINDDEILNMDTVRRLAFGDINPFDFMEKFPGNIDESDPAVYHVGLPNDYWIRIEYSGDSIISVFLEDYRLNQSINLGTQKIELDEFLLQRGDE